MSESVPNAAALKSNVDYTTDIALQTLGGVITWTYGGGGLFYNLVKGNDLSMSDHALLSTWLTILYSLNTGTSISTADLNTLTNSVISGAKSFSAVIPSGS